MKHIPQKLIKKTAFVFKSQKNQRLSSTDPTNSSITVIATETFVALKK
ncbi:hypothetical protein [Pedobacter roseus]|uniref:Uncharacterized protein n=1 Tax=Pedobacter roseus TaxID=336820 RepID=A0A7G9QH82_9SPHI|nr:hypothetical protein [Pedobacter roseus]QNN42707.1 hypothetical protein H9L23_00895 [Pedobacter roseus]